MIRYESECVSCGLPCLSKACPYYSVPHYYCDECGDETDIYEYDGEQLCISCIEHRLDKVNNN